MIAILRRVIVCGTRTFNDRELLYSTLDNILGDPVNVEIISGGCRGADRIAEDYAKSRGLRVTVFEAYWDEYGKSAGPIRNRQMLNYALGAEAIVVAFWDGKSRGTANMINIAKRSNAEVHVITSGL